MTDPTTSALAGLLIFGTSVWIGGLIAIAVVARSASETLEPAARIAFFRSLGRSYGILATVALAIALGSGAALVHGRPWSGRLVAAVALAAVLAVTLVVGIAQARRMTRLRGRLLDTSDDDVAAQVRRGAPRAAALRGLIALLSLALLAVGVTLAT